MKIIVPCILPREYTALPSVSSSTMSINRFIVRIKIKDTIKVEIHGDAPDMIWIIEVPNTSLGYAVVWDAFDRMLKISIAHDQGVVDFFTRDTENLDNNRHDVYLYEGPYGNKVVTLSENKNLLFVKQLKLTKRRLFAYAIFNSFNVHINT